MTNWGLQSWKDILRPHSRGLVVGTTTGASLAGLNRLPSFPLRSHCGHWIRPIFSKCSPVSTSGRHTQSWSTCTLVFSVQIEPFSIQVLTFEMCHLSTRPITAYKTLTCDPSSVSRMGSCWPRSSKWIKATESQCQSAFSPQREAHPVQKYLQKNTLGSWKVLFFR